MSPKNTVPVSHLVKKVNAFIQKKINLSSLLISGELSNVKRVNGHYYFNLKDPEGQLSCTMWKSYAFSLPFVPKDGLQVLVHGSLNVYEKRGSLQLSVDSMQLDGLGALYLQLEELKKRLSAQGYFSQEHKKPKPDWIEDIAIVTGKSTAALQDVLQTLRQRWPMLKITLYPASVQGEEAPAQIVKALQRADKKGHDAILLVRGGGSFEDLFCFNDEEIVKTLYDLDTYVVTGIGHEIDTSLADLAADYRALTPTAAAQWITLDQRDVKAHLREIEQQMFTDVQRIFHQNTQRLIFIQKNQYLTDPQSWLEPRKHRLKELDLVLKHDLESWMEKPSRILREKEQDLLGSVSLVKERAEKHLETSTNRLWLNSPKSTVALRKQQLESLRKRMIQNVKHGVSRQKQALSSSVNLLEAVSPASVMKRGYALVYQEGKMAGSASAVKEGEKLSIRFYDGSVEAQSIRVSADQPFEEEVS